MKTQTKILEEELVKNLCSVEFRSKSETKRLIDEYTEKILANQLEKTTLAIADETNEARSNNESTSRLTSLYLKVVGKKPLDILETVRKEVDNVCYSELIYAGKTLADSGEMGARNVVVKRIRQALTKFTNNLDREFNK